MASDAGTLYVVATPIGHLDDITLRARGVLGDVDLVAAAEDTRRARRLLAHLGLRKRLLSLHEHNESTRSRELLNVLADGSDVALISDAGTPLISDPGYRIVAGAAAAGIGVVPVPGCCAAIAALSVAGLPTDRFRFEGFLPSRAAARRRRLASLCAESETLVLYESVHRIDALLADLAELAGPDRPIFVARELTKLHESLYRGNVAEVRAALAADAGGAKGEFTVVVGGAAAAAPPDRREAERVVAALLRELSARQAAALAAEITGLPRREAYRLANALKNKA